ncbi:MAG: hypothetical protein RL329_463 [Bacteroidota bacterium]|jgi:hypothetical protein
MKIKLLFCLSMLSSHFLTAQCALEKQLLGRWIWANTAEIVAVFQFNKSPTVDISIPMTAYMTQTIDKVVVKVLQFQDMAVQGRILTVVISENGQNSCKKSDSTFKYTVSAEFQGKKYTGCGQ